MRSGDSRFYKLCFYFEVSRRTPFFSPCHVLRSKYFVFVCVHAQDFNVFFLTDVDCGQKECKVKIFRTNQAAQGERT